jgi:hypothetical protein
VFLPCFSATGMLVRLQKAGMYIKNIHIQIAKGNYIQDQLHRFSPRRRRRELLNTLAANVDLYSHDSRSDQNFTFLCISVVIAFVSVRSWTFLISTATITIAL